MTVTIEKLMARGVVVAAPDHTVDYVRRQMRTLGIHAVPVAGADGEPVGIVRARDLLGAVDADRPVADVMCREAVVVDRFTEVGAAAARMRRQRQHHVVVVEAGRIVGIVSAFDFLELIEGYRFSVKPDSPDFQTGEFRIPDDELDGKS